MSREKIMEKVRTTVSRLPRREDYPVYEETMLHSAPRLQGSSLWEMFRRNFCAVNGKTMESIGELVDFLQAHGWQQGYCDPELMESVGHQLADAGFHVESTYERERYDWYQFGITRATSAVAESGSVVLDDLHTSDRLAALSPWVHVAILREDQIYRTIPDAIAALGNSPNIIWCTGPSKTADVEGILIEGVHGPGEQIVLRHAW
jgi:L-lactate dehydrogenase complex protein LldG